jgi:hypothetical protein
VLIVLFVESVLENSYDFNIGVWGWPKKGPDIFVVIPKVNLRIRNWVRMIWRAFNICIYPPDWEQMKVLKSTN